MGCWRKHFKEKQTRQETQLRPWDWSVRCVMEVWKDSEDEYSNDEKCPSQKDWSAKLVHIFSLFFFAIFHNRRSALRTRWKWETASSEKGSCFYKAQVRGNLINESFYQSHYQRCLLDFPEKERKEHTATALTLLGKQRTAEEEKLLSGLLQEANQESLQKNSSLIGFGRHPRLPVFSSSVKLESQAGRGRFLVAATNICPGKWIFWCFLNHKLFMLPEVLLYYRYYHSSLGSLV